MINIEVGKVMIVGMKLHCRIYEARYLARLDLGDKVPNVPVLLIRLYAGAVSGLAISSGDAI